MNTLNKLIFPGCLFLTLGCGRDSSKQSGVPPQSSAPAQTCVPDAESRGEIRPGPIQEYTVSLERISQRVTRKKSDGMQVSDQIEDIKAPTQRFSFKPVQALSGPALGVKLKNRRNCASATIKKIASEMPSDLDPLASAILGFVLPVLTADGTASVPLDQGKGFTTFWVEPGLNLIEYDFLGACLQPAANQNGDVFESCDKFTILESGTLKIKIDYSAKMLDGVREVIDAAN